MPNPPVRFKFSDIELAFDLVSMVDGEQEAYLCLDSGDILYFSEVGESDDPPEDFEFSDRYIAVPTKRDLDLGRSVVTDFVDAHAAHVRDEVRDIFSRRGAYGQFKALLRRHGIEDQWHAFENHREAEEIRAWCHEHGIALDEECG